MTEPNKEAQVPDPEGRPLHLQKLDKDTQKETLIVLSH